MDMLSGCLIVVLRAIKFLLAIRAVKQWHERRKRKRAATQDDDDESGARFTRSEQDADDPRDGDQRES